MCAASHPHCTAPAATVQAIDIVHPWTLDATGHPLLPITTFSIAMAHRQSGGRLNVFVEGLKTLTTPGCAGARGPLSAADRVLIAEACNHNRITADCNDIGMVQLPDKLKKMTGGQGPVIEHAFGRWVLVGEWGEAHALRG